MAALPYDTALIDASIQLYDDLSRSMIVDVFELVDVAYHDKRKRCQRSLIDRSRQGSQEE
jgi:hypothetical protein|tara:strand:- start:133 stop:312 length:180 start_codon:yes stop_codon:yes gene_type:complete